MNCKRIDCDAVGSKYFIRGGCTHVEAKWPCFKEFEAKRMMGKTFAENLLQGDDNEDVGAGLSIFHGQKKKKKSQQKTIIKEEDDWDSDMEVIFGNK